jgi:Flp pilus assembly protein TadG
MRLGKPKLGRLASERGVEVVEAGTIIVLIFGLLFLLMNLTMGIFVRSTLQNAVREGVRFAVTENPGSGTDQYLNDAIVSTVQQHALGLLNGTSGACDISVSYYTPSGSTASGPGTGNIVQVAVNHSFHFLTSPINMTAISSDVMEQCPLAGCPQGANPANSCP